MADLHPNTNVLLQGRWLAVGHVGDSLVVLGKDDGSVGYEAEVLTERHSGVDEAERHRLMSQWGGKVQFKGKCRLLFCVRFLCVIWSLKAEDGILMPLYAVPEWKFEVCGG